MLPGCRASLQDLFLHLSTSKWEKVLFLLFSSSQALKKTGENVRRCQKLPGREKSSLTKSNQTLTWKPPLMVSPNQICFLSLLLLLHQFFLGTFAGLG